MFKRNVVIVIAALLPVLSACHDVTEYSGTPEAGLLFLDPVTLEVEGTLSGVPGAVSICATGMNSFCVASSEGVLYLYDADAMELDTSFVIGGQSSAGYGSMVYIPWKSSLYVIGTPGSIIEVGIPGGEIRDVLTSVDSPGRLVSNRTQSFMYVENPNTNSVFRISTTNNSVFRVYEFDRTPSGVICGTTGDDTLLVATNDPQNIAYVQPVDYAYPRVAQFAPVVDMERSIDHYGLIYALRNHDTAEGALTVVDSLFPFSNYTPVFFPGTPRALQNHTDGLRLFILSVVKNGSYRVLCYHQDFETIVKTVDLPGYPVDMTSAGDRLVVLSY
ncbi:MAG: hypothetical protein R6V62_09295 [Candidatus Fermentibacteraceae bacterium]